jgi:DNA-binding transcriptional regulator YdaS (Cro superfamily)
VQPARGGGGDKILTSDEAAKLIGVSPRRVLQFCEEARFSSARRVELNQRWVVLESEVRDYVRRPTGRPKRGR